MTAMAYPVRPPGAAPQAAATWPAGSFAPSWPFGRPAAPAERDAQLAEVTLDTVRQALLPLMSAWNARP